MNTIDRLISVISPGWAAHRMRYRQELRAYESVETSRLRRTTRQSRGPNKSVKAAVKPLREQVRALEENHDLTVGVINAFVANVVGSGIAVEPQPKTLEGEIHDDMAKALLMDWERWCEMPETSRTMSKSGMERAACIAWMRDGEIFGQHLVGRIGGFRHAGPVPYSVQMFESDYCPMQYDDAQLNIVQGVQVDRWGKPITYYLYPEHPNDSDRFVAEYSGVPAERILHLKHNRRVHQVRGVSMLAPVLNRIRDLKDYEEAEIVAGRVAASMAVVVKKGTPDMYSDADVDDDGNRLFSLEPGIIWDNLQAGESVETIQSNRPSMLLQPFRDSMLKAIASGTGTSYSTISKDYSGTFSSQRQELVEQWANYSSATQHFITQWTRPIYQRFVAQWLIVNGRQFAGVDPLSLLDAEYRGPVMPWIDPVKESTAQTQQVQAGFKSRSQVIRERGGNPANVFNELVRERSADYAEGLVLSSDYATQAQRGELDLDPRDNTVNDDEEQPDDRASAA